MTGVVLAAGAGRRFGGPKALVDFRGARFIDRAVRLLHAGGCERVVVVSGAVELDVPDAEVVHNPDWETGMGSSLRVGLTTVGGEDAVVVPVDMPWLGPESIRRVLAADESLAIATYGGIRAHPVLLGAPHHPGIIASAIGDAGARHYLRAHSHLVVEVPCDDTGSPRDVDHPRDLEADGDPPRGH